MTTPHARLVAELHCHSEFSPDGLITFEGMLRTAQRRGIGAICITDHDTVEGAFEFQRRARAKGSPLQIVVGEERTLEDNSHLIGLFLREHIRSSRLADAIEEIHADGGAVLLPHPYRRGDGLLRAIQQPTAEHIRGIDAFELFNAKSSFADNARARTLVDLSLGVFGGSDAHYESDIGQCVCEMPLRGGVEDTLRAMLKRELPFTVRGIHKKPGSGERRYAPAYYKIKPFLRLPRPLVPAAKQVYRFYRNHILQGSRPLLEEIYLHE
jgi:predicted metal-dependent phosphoesterase TrpH